MYYKPEVKEPCEAFLNEEMSITLFTDRLRDQLMLAELKEVDDVRHVAATVRNEFTSSVTGVSHPWINITIGIYFTRMAMKLFNLTGSMEYLESLFEMELHILNDYCTSVINGDKLPPIMTCNKQQADETIEGVLSLLDREHTIKALVMWELILDCEGLGEFTSKTPLYARASKRLRTHLELPLPTETAEPYSRISSLEKTYTD